MSNIVSHKHNRHETACEPRNYTLIIFCIVFFIGEIGRDYRWPAKVDTLVDYFIDHGICKARLKFWAEVVKDNKVGILYDVKCLTCSSAEMLVLYLSEKLKQRGENDAVALLYKFCLLYTSDAADE